MLQFPYSAIQLELDVYCHIVQLELDVLYHDVQLELDVLYHCFRLNQMLESKTRVPTG
jgi:hypothetical protein